MNKILVALVLVVFSTVSIAGEETRSLPDRFSEQVMEQARADKRDSQIRRRSKTNFSAVKLDRNLSTLLEKTSARSSRSKSGESARAEEPGHPFLRLNQAGAVQVYVAVDNVALDTLSSLSRAGLQIELSDAKTSMVQGWIAPERLGELASLPSVNKVKSPHYGESRKGAYQTQGDTILRSRQLRQSGLRGQGARVGIISDGANNWTAARATGDLPASLTRYGSCSRRSANPSNCSGGVTCNEGTAMAEIIHDIAPDATLAVAAASTSLEFIQRVNQLANSFKADIIVDDLGFLAEPYFEDGDIARAVAAVAGNVLFVSAAGNSAGGHYERNYLAYPGRTSHDFGRAIGRSADDAFGVVVPARTGLLGILQWNDPYANASNDYDLYLLNQSGIETASTGDQINGDPTAIEGFCWYNATSTDQLRWFSIDRFAGANKRLEMIISTRGVQEYNDTAGSIFGHPGVEDVLAVGAINAGDAGHNNIAFYSSRGPSRVDFPSVVNRRKPDLAAIDGVSVSGAGGFSSPFFGTSAAAPHVAGIAAQLFSVGPGVTVGNVRNALRKGAVDLGSTGFDSVYGYGRVDALNARTLIRQGYIPGSLLLLLLDE